MNIDKINVNLKNIFAGIFMILIAGIIVFTHFNNKIPSYINLSIFISVFSLGFLFIFTKKIMDLRIIYIFIVIIFHLGGIIAYFLTDGYLEVQYWIYQFDESVLNKALLIYVLSLLMYCTGVVVALSFNSTIKKNTKKKLQIKNEFPRLEKIGFFLLSITSPLYVYLILERIITLQNHSYIDTYRSDLPTMLITFSKLIYAAMIFIIIGQSYKKAKLSLRVFVSVLLISMLGGARGEAATTILALVYVFYKIHIQTPKGKRTKTKMNPIKLIIFGLIFLVIINVMREYRSMDIINLYTINVLLKDSFQFDFVFELLVEFSNSLKTLIYSIVVFPTHQDWGKGITYLTSIFSIFPNINQIIPYISETWSFTQLFPFGWNFSIGGSIIGEAYYNFGVYSPFFFVLVGMLISFINRIINYDMLLKSPLKVAVVSSILPQIFILVRGYTVDFVRILVFIYISILLINVFYSSFRKERLYE